LLSLLLYRPNLKNIYETRPFKTACTGCTKNGCNIIWTFAGNIIFLLYIKKACPTLFTSCRKRSKRRSNKSRPLMAITLYYETQNTAILPDKVTPPQPASHPASITFNDKTHLSLREAPAAPIQYKEVAPPPSPDSVSSSILHSTSNNVNPLGKTAAKP